ncbi:MAG: OmpA family protein [Bacteroidales bacterium]
MKDLACAEQEFRKAVKADERFSEAWIVLGEVLADQGRFDEALETFESAIKKGKTYYPEVLYFMGTLELKKGDYEKARYHFSEFLASQPASPRREAMAKRQLADCEFALQAVQNPVPFNPINMGPDINSEYSEYFPCLTVDDQMMLFTRRIPSIDIPGREQEDFFVSRKVDNHWTKAEPIGKPINTRYNEGAPTLSPDGNYLIFTACASQGDYGQGRQGYGSCDLFISRKMGSEWSEPSNIGFPVNTAKWETQPSFSSDGRTLYFIRGFTDARGYYSQDIYSTQLQDDGTWSEPQKLPDYINSPADEESVFIHPDGQTLYFSSDGWPGMGGKDIYMCRLQPDGTWSKPENLGYPINTANDENSLMVSGNGKYGFFASDRPGGYGKLDLYYFEIPESLRPKPLTYLKGTVYDASDGHKLSAHFELIDLNSGHTVVTSSSDPVDGTFLVALPSGSSYALNVSHPGYLFYSDHFDLQGTFTAHDPFLKDVPLQPVSVGKEVVLKNVFFQTDSYQLLPESKVELDRLAGLLKQNPNLIIEISGHTDSQGSDAHNIELSLNRARAVYEYLINQGIASERLIYKGYGRNRPIDTNETPEGRANNRRTEFKVIKM